MSTVIPPGPPLLPDPTGGEARPALPECVPSLEGLITEDHKPVDRIFIEKLYRLLTRPLYASWRPPGPEGKFLVLVNVGWFYKEKTPAVVPDCLLSLGVDLPEDLQVKEGHSYYQWRMGKPPDVIIEAVSDTTGGEESWKKALFARQGVPIYAVFDPGHRLSNDTLRTYALSAGDYGLVEPGPWPALGLGLRLWQGTFEGATDTWLRWCDQHGQLIPTGEERAAAESARADRERDRAVKAEQLAEQEHAASDRERDRAEKAEQRIRELEEALRKAQGQS
jgi:hypothetical protein